MAKITAIRAGRGQGKRLNVFLDGRFAFSLGAEVAAKESLQVGQELSSRQIELLHGSDRFHRCLNAALHYLGYRPRSESELRERLGRRNFDADTVNAVLARLKEQGLVDDVSFSKFWLDNRQSFSPRSQWLTKLELRQKGVKDDVIDQVTSSIDDEASAYQAALIKTHGLFQSDYQSFRRRLGGYLKRRGFGYGVINLTLERVWQEVNKSYDEKELKYGHRNRNRNSLPL